MSLLTSLSRKPSARNFRAGISPGCRPEEAQPITEFYDIGAIVFFLKIIAWQIPDFSAGKYRDPLAALHQHIYC